MTGNAKFDETWIKYRDRICGQDPSPYLIDLGRAWFFLGARTMADSLCAIKADGGNEVPAIEALLRYVNDELRIIGSNLAPPLSDPKDRIQ